MGFNYYEILGVNTSADETDVRKKYRILALQYHTQLLCQNNLNDQLIIQNLLKISEAYDVLQNPLYRAVYDRFGEEGLKSGLPIQDGFIEPYVYHGNWKKTYSDFFGSSNPYADIVNTSLQLHGTQFGKPGKIKGAPVRSTLFLSLEEIYSGCIKKMRISRQVMNGDGKSTSRQEKILTCNVKPGIPKRSEIVFKEEGDQAENMIPGDIIFVIDEKSHPKIIREENNLKYSVTVPLLDALNGFKLQIVTLDNRILHVFINEIISPGYTKIIKEEGMPVWDHPEIKGNLIINFNIIFPQTLMHAQREILKIILKEGEMSVEELNLLNALATILQDKKKWLKIWHILESGQSRFAENSN